MKEAESFHASATHYVDTQGGQFQFEHDKRTQLQKLNTLGMDNFNTVQAGTDGGGQFYPSIGQITSGGNHLSHPSKIQIVNSGGLRLDDYTPR